MPKKPPIKRQRLFAVEAHEVFRITDDGDDSEPPKLCDTSMIQIEQDTGEKLVLLALELDELARKWLKRRKKKPTRKPQVILKMKRGLVECIKNTSGATVTLRDYDYQDGKPLVQTL